MRLPVLTFFLLLFSPFLHQSVSLSYWIPMYKKDTPYCMKPLLRSEDFHPGRHIKVSSEYEAFGDRRRVVEEGDPWCASPGNRFGEWVQVDLGSMKLISGVLIEGWKWHESKTQESVEWDSRVTHYSVEFSPDGRLWTVLKDEHGLPQHFHSMREHKSVRRNYYKARARYQSFDPLLHARFFRLKIQAWTVHQCLTMELYGCESHWTMGNIQLMQPQRSISIADCHYINPIDVRYWQLTTDSAKYTKYYGADRKGSERKWCVDRTSRRNPPWLEFDLLHRRFISRIEVTLFDGREGKRSQNLDVRTVRFSEDKVGWIGFQPNKKTPSRKISYASRPVSARYVRIPTDKFRFSLTCLRLNLFGCSDEVQSLGLWSNQGRIKISGATVYDMSTRSDLRFIEPGQTLYCSRAGPDKMVYFRVDMRKLFAITRLVFIGETKRAGTSLKCVRDESRKLLSLFTSLDGRLWSPFGIYNQIHGDKIRQGFQLDYDTRFQCAAVLDVRPTIYGQHFWIREDTDSRSLDCVAMEIFGNEAGKSLPYQGKRKPGCSAPLGMESRKIRDNQIKVTTFSTGINMKARNARLNSNGGWCVKTIENYVYKKKRYHLPSEFLEIDLLSEKFIDGFATQGHPSRSLVRWVTGFIVHHSNDGFSWDVISGEERERYFVANKNTRDTVRHYLNPRIRARYLRFLPVTWHKSICMRVEIYGCDAGESLQDKLEKKLLDINKERVEYILTYQGILKNRYRKDYNIYYKRDLVICGPLPQYGVPWTNQHYLWEVLDETKTAWVQDAFNNEFNASGHFRLFLDERRALKTRSGKHFICKGKLRDGTEIYRHHVITAKVGINVPSKLDSHPWMHVGTQALWFSSTLEVPQIIIQQRVDQAYDGGKPVWGMPAVVYASGSVASIGVIVIGIPYFTVAVPRSYIKDRGWRQSYLGPVREDQYALRNCAKLALLKGYDHFIRHEDMCYSSHAMPANLYKLDDKDYGKETKRDHREFVQPYFIKGMKKFEKYQIKWSKFDPKRKQWVQIFKYYVTDPQRQTSSLFTMKPENDNDHFAHERSRARGRYRAYDKAYYGDHFTGSHVLDIERVTTADLGTYKIEVFNPWRLVGNEAIIELRHEDEPRISLPETFGACSKTPLKMNVTLHDDNSRYPSLWNVDWYHVRIRKDKRYRTRKVRNSATLTEPNPLPKQTGQLYEADVRNPFGFARGVTRIIVTEDVPSINWVTPSPHLAAKDVSDLLEVKIENDKTLVTVDWYHNGTLIDRTTDGFTFPGEKYGATSFRKKLKLARISFNTAGTYRIVARGKYCQFERKVEVRVIIRPRLIAEPHAVYKRVDEGEYEVKMNVTVKGGEPKPQLEDMGWKKSGKPLSPSRYGRVILHTTLNKREDWFTALVIRDLKESDSGDYTFSVKTGPVVSSVTRSLVVLPKQDYINYNTTVTDTPILELTTSPTESRGQRVLYSFTLMLLHFPCILSGIVYNLYQ